MLIYGYRGKKCLVSTNENNYTNLWALVHYYDGSYSYEYPTSMVMRHIYCSYTTLCRFNNSLTSTYEVDDKEVRKFVAYLDRFVRQTSSKNDINYRISSLYNYIVSKYSDYMEINEIVLNEN